MATETKKAQLAQKHWDRYNDMLQRGHIQYQKAAKTNEDFYLGAGRQWSEESKRSLEAVNKPWIEENMIFSTINSVLGTQTQSRMDITFKPRDPEDQTTSDVLTKIAMFVLDQNKMPWTESQVFADGIIQQRGYFDIRMDFEENLNGEIKITDLDPLDVLPDPDAKTYDPDDWTDVITTKWIPMDDVKLLYGTKAFRAVSKSIETEADFGQSNGEQERNRFGTATSFNAFHKDTTSEEHVRIIERQWWKLQMRSFWYDLETGEITPIPDDMSTAEANKIAKGSDRSIIKKLSRRVRWTVSTSDVLLHDDWSPYDHFTVVPYFPFFRRGVTLGLVDNLIKNQEMMNKVFSQILHIVNSTANSGWILEENSLSNMDTEDLEDVGGQTGLVIEHRQGKGKPEKIQPNPVPSGLKDLVTTGVELTRLISGVSETFQGGKSNEVSGVAIQSKVQQTAVQLATPIDNLFRTRNMLASRIMKLIQQFYTEPRIFLINGQEEGEGDEGNEAQSVEINGEDEETGEILNDVTVGKYDVVISDVPTQITFQNAQFAQALEMRKFGIEVPDDEMIKMSTLSRKQQIAKKMAGETSPEQQQAEQEQLELQLELLRNQVKKASAEVESEEGKALEDTAKVAQMLSENPNLGAILDTLLEKSLSEAEQQPEQPLQEEQPAPQQLGAEDPLAGFNFNEEGEV